MAPEQFTVNGIYPDDVLEHEGNHLVLAVHIDQYRGGIRIEEIMFLPYDASILCLPNRARMRQRNLVIAYIGSLACDLSLVTRHLSLTTASFMPVQPSDLAAWARRVGTKQPPGPAGSSRATPTKQNGWWLLSVPRSRRCLAQL